jgi:hypothetical protein
MINLLVIVWLVGAAGLLTIVGYTRRLVGSDEATSWKDVAFFLLWPIVFFLLVVLPKEKKW